MWERNVQFSITYITFSIHENEPQKHKHAVFNQNNSTPVWLKSIQTYACIDAAHQPSGKTSKITNCTVSQSVYRNDKETPLSTSVFSFS